MTYSTRRQAVLAAWCAELAADPTDPHRDDAVRELTRRGLDDITRDQIDRLSERELAHLEAVCLEIADGKNPPESVFVPESECWRCAFASQADMDALRVVLDEDAADAAAERAQRAAQENDEQAP